METTLLFVIIGCSAVAGILVIAYLIGCALYRHRLSGLYKENNRDERFACALLTQIFGNKIIKRPYVLRDDSEMSPRVDAIYVCSGGIAVISVQKGGGLYSAPEQGQWRVIDNGQLQITDNLLERQQVYAAEISAVLMKNSLRCPAIRGYVFLTDDYAETDYMSSDLVLSGSRLIEELRDFDSQKRLKPSEQKAILETLHKNHTTVRQTYLYRSQRDIAVPNPEKEEETSEEEEFDLSGLILVSDDSIPDEPADLSGSSAGTICVPTEDSPDGPMEDSVEDSPSSDDLPEEKQVG